MSNVGALVSGASPVHCTPEVTGQTAELDLLGRSKTVVNCAASLPESCAAEHSGSKPGLRHKR